MCVSILYSSTLRVQLRSLRSCIPYAFLSLALTLVAASSAPSVGWATWSEDGRESGCVRYRGAKRDQMIPMRVVCVWPVSKESLKAVLESPQDYDQCFSRVEQSDLISVSTRRGLRRIRVYQIHESSPASDRAIYIDYREEERGDVWRLRFGKSPRHLVKPITDFIEVKENRGYWQVEPHSRGARLTFEGLYDPGGSVPSFLVRWFLSGGVQTMMDELRACAEQL